MRILYHKKRRNDSNTAPNFYQSGDSGGSGGNRTLVGLHENGIIDKGMSTEDVDDALITLIKPGKHRIMPD